MHGEQVLDELGVVIGLLLLVALLGGRLHAGQALHDLLVAQVRDVHLVVIARVVVRVMGVDGVGGFRQG